MPGAPATSDEARWQRWRAVATLYHAVFTGLILSVVTRRGAPAAAEFVFRIFRHQQLERFLPGLDKLGLKGLPPAVAAAQYHYLSNWIGGVPVEYMYESDRKAWVRYPPPRWIWRGNIIAGIPGEVSRAMLRGWHGNNGVVLGNLKLGFVCTKQTVDGQDGLEGYYREYDHDLDVDERVVFAREQEAPPFDVTKAPALPVEAWPQARLEKAFRNYAMEYVRTAAPIMVQQFGPDDGGHLLRLTAKLIGMQYFHETARGLLPENAALWATNSFVGAGGARVSARDFASFLSAMLSAQGDVAEMSSGGAIEIAQQSWKLMDGVSYHPSCVQLLDGLIEGLAAAAGRGIVARRLTDNADQRGIVWRIAGPMR
jgi:hypothetical protein